uniref:Sodium/glucose cotransporter 1-like n=1 Tax=Nannospalax galili TaxID=1026970 RepID=A0A8C6QW30_NANGA
MNVLDKYHTFPLNKSYVGLSIIGALDTLVVILYLLLTLSIGLWVGSSLFSANIGSGHFMGLAGVGAFSGIAVGAFEWNSIFAFFVLGWIFVPFYDKARVVTVPEYLRKRFGSVRIQLFFSFVSLLVYIFTRISMEICFGTMFLKMVLDTDIYQTMMLILTVTGIYTVTGGLTAVAYAEAFQAFIMILGSAISMGYAFNAVGGYQQFVHKYFQAIPSVTRQGNWTAKPKCYTPRPDAFHIFRSPTSGDIPWPGLIFGGTIVSLFYGCADQVSVQRFLAGKSMLHMKGGCLFCGYLKLLPMFLMVMPGMISRILFSDQVACVVPPECQKFCDSQTGCSTLAYPVLVTKVMPSGLRGFMLSTVCASLMSSLTSVFNSSSALFTMNIYTWIQPLSTEKELMIAG